MKILCLCSALDLQHRYGCTPAWWQLFKGLHELGHDVISVPYRGASVESPWWRVYPNPCRLEGEAFAAAKRAWGRLSASGGPSVSGRLSRRIVESWIRPRWEKHVAGILRQEKNVSAVLVFTIPLHHLQGIATRLRAQFQVPFFFYDGDVPASLPRFGGFASGFRVYDDGDLSEYDGFICNSEGGAAELEKMGARRVGAVHWGVDPDLYAPLDVPFTHDVFFHGFGMEYRERWIEDMLVAPSRALLDHSFAVGGHGFHGDLGNVAQTGDVPLSLMREACCSSRINLNITREAHATVFASSTMRPFELAAMGCCIVSNPCAGLDTWFDLTTDMAVVQSSGEAIETYRRLLADPSRRQAMGQSARARVIERHTHRAWAVALMQFINTC